MGTIMINPIRLPCLPLIDRSLFDNAQNGFQPENLQMFYPTTFVRWFPVTILHVLSEASMRIIRLANVANIEGERISKGINESRSNTGVALRNMRWYSVLHSKGHSLLSRLGVLAAPLRHHNITSSVYHKSASQATSCPFSHIQLLNIITRKRGPYGRI